MVRLTTRDCPLAQLLSQRLRAEKIELTRHWLGRISARVSLDVNALFPSEELLDHVPLLIDGIADYVADPSAEVSAEIPVVAKAMELGSLRHAQGFDAYEILKEYEILGGILFHFLAQAVDDIDQPCEKSELLVCGHRLFRAVAVIQEATTAQFLKLADERIAEREQRLRGFGRTVSHELKNRIGVVLGASEALLELDSLTPERRRHFVEMIARNMHSMNTAVENILELSRLDGRENVRGHRHVQLPEAAREAFRQVREAAAAAEVEVRLRPDLPNVEVNAAATEVCLTNYLTNAIKYADPARPDRYVEVSAMIEERPEHGREIVVRVRDNGLGVPDDQREHLFERFFRAHETVTGAEGTGLGLSIVADTAASQGGRAWAEFPPRGSIFAFSLPLRRAADAAPRAPAREEAPAG